MQRSSHQVNVYLACIQSYYILTKQLVRQVRHTQRVQKGMVGKGGKGGKKPIQRQLKQGHTAGIPVCEITVQFFQPALKEKIKIRHMIHASPIKS